MNRKYLAKSVRNQKRYEASLSSKQRSQVKRLLHNDIERRVFDTDVALATNVDDTGNVYDLSLVPVANRDGTEFRQEKLTMKYDITAVAAPAQIRVIVFQSKVDSGVHTIVPADILEDLDPSSQYQYPPRLQYKILYDRRHQTGDATTPGSAIYAFGSVNIKANRLTKKVVSAEAATSGTNHIYMLVIGNRATTNRPTIRAHARLSYTDA